MPVPLMGARFSSVGSGESVQNLVFRFTPHQSAFDSFLFVSTGHPLTGLFFTSTQQFPPHSVAHLLHSVSKLSKLERSRRSHTPRPCVSIWREKPRYYSTCSMRWGENYYLLLFPTHWLSETFQPRIKSKNGTSGAPILRAGCFWPITRRQLGGNKTSF